MKNNNKMIVPKLRFKEFEQVNGINLEFGDILFESISNKNHNSELPILAITQEQGAIPRDQIDYNVSVTEKSVASYKVVDRGDFIISLRSFQGGIEYSLYKGICSPAYIILRKKNNLINEYYKYYFKSYQFIKEMNKDLEGIRDGKMVSYAQFSKLLLPHPLSEEQQKIADCLTSLDELISAENKRLELLKDHKKGLMQKLFPAEGETMPEWRFPEFRDGREWKKYKLNDICNYNSSSLTINHARTDGEYDFYDANSMIGKIDSYASNKPYITIIKDGAGVGRLRKLQEYTNFVGTMGMLTNNTLCIFEFFYHLLNSIDFQIFVVGSTIPHIYFKDYSQKIIFIPKDPREQQKIANCLSSVDDLISEQAKKIDQLKEHKRGLMQALFPSIQEVE